jgi:hypothetical protein
MAMVANIMIFFIFPLSPICLGIHIKVLVCPCIVGSIYL